jgi:hypothetical protein
MKKRFSVLLFLTILLLAIPSSALAQTYYFSVDEEIINVFWEENGTLTVDYVLVFTNSPGASPIDFVDIGLPNNNYSISNITADIDGHPIDDIEDSPYVTYGVALGLWENSIPPGETGRVHMTAWGISNVLYTDSSDRNYASAVFSPTWFDSEFIYGSTDLTVIFHLPPGVTPEEPRWHSSPSGDWPSEPETYLDDSERVTYVWHNPNANAHTQYKFGASFPKSYVPSSAIYTPSIWQQLGIDEDSVIGFGCCASIFAFIALVAWGSIVSDRRRKLKYLPPKIRIEGHGIKRGLTAIEAAILMEQPMDKVLTMILFSVIKKGAADVTSREPLKLKIADPLPDGLRTYESDFLKAFGDSKITNARRKRELQNLMVQLIRSVSKKMKGFSHKETVAYYRSIMEKAWAQVEAADTPEVRGQKFDENIGWTMLDRDFDDRTQDVFRGGPVYVPVWWHRYDPGYAGSLETSSRTAPARPTSGSGRSAPTMPMLPGGEFAASVVTGIQNFSSDVVGNITDFTSGITKTTNPIPKSSTRSGGFSSRSGGGSSCACACACAGCACACAGGGR